MNSENYVYKKEVDWSVFNYGFAIPVEYQVVFKQISDRFLERGESKVVTLYLNGKSYQARIQNNKIDKKFGNRADIVQVRYSPNSDLAQALRGSFYHSFSYISNVKQAQKAGSKSHISLPDEYKEYLAIYTAEYDYSFVLETICSEDMTIFKHSLDGKTERTVEAEIDFEVRISVWKEDW